MRGGGAADAAEDAERFGFPAELVREIAGSGNGAGEIWPENWDTVCAFAAVLTQWRTTPRGDGGTYFIGLDYAAARAGLDAEGVVVSAEIWRGLRIMEAEAAAALNGHP